MDGYIEEGKPIKCMFIKCAAGMGVAGSRHCFLSGDPENKDCTKFVSDDEFESRQIKGGSK